MKKKQIPVIVLVLLTAGYVAFIAGSSSMLPQRVAIHFGLNGQANNWTSRSQTAIFFEALAGVPALFAVLALLITVMPTGAMNLPHKNYWLSPERRDQTVAWISRQAAWMGCLTVPFWAGVYWLMIRANESKPTQLPMNLFWLMVGTYLAAIFLWVIRFYSHFRKPS